MGLLGPQGSALWFFVNRNEAILEGSVLLERAMTATTWMLGRIASFPKDQRYLVGDKAWGSDPA